MFKALGKIGPKLGLCFRAMSRGKTSKALAAQLAKKKTIVKVVKKKHIIDADGVELSITVVELEKHGGEEESDGDVDEFQGMTHEELSLAPGHRERKREEQRRAALADQGTHGQIMLCCLSNDNVDEVVHQRVEKAKRERAEAGGDEEEEFNLEEFVKQVEAGKHIYPDDDEEEDDDNNSNPSTTAPGDDAVGGRTGKKLSDDDDDNGEPMKRKRLGKGKGKGGDDEDSDDGLEKKKRDGKRAGKGEKRAAEDDTNSVSVSDNLGPKKTKGKGKTGGALAAKRELAEAMKARRRQKEKEQAEAKAGTAPAKKHLGSVPIHRIGEKHAVEGPVATTDTTEKEGPGGDETKETTDAEQEVAPQPQFRANCANACDTEAACTIM